MDGDCLRGMHNPFLSVSVGIYQNVRCRRGTLYTICRFVSAHLPFFDNFYMCSKGLRYFPAIHRTRKSGSAFIHFKRCTAYYFLAYHSDFRRCYRYFLGCLLM